ncbi:hypothetical protein HJFPF1_05648 [Paramyrothecium foliicola]|nr:hypothetical protein HJFPF1_05648 [Paramyrothecium foliicola]
MDDLPQEILDHIISFIPKYSGHASPTSEHKLIRPGLATVSHAWQEAVEPLTFKELHIKDTELWKLCEVFSRARGARRRHLLRTLHYDVVLPSYSDAACAEYETDHDREENNGVASRTVRQILQYLSQWPVDTNLRLLIEIYSPMDGTRRGEERWNKERMAARVGTRRDLFENRYHYSYIRLSGIDHLQVDCVRDLTYLGRNLHPSSQAHLTTLCPNITRMNWSYLEPAGFQALQRQHRKDFMASLENFDIPASATKVHVDFTSCDLPHGKRLPNLTGGAAEDPLSLAFHDIIARSGVQELAFAGHIDPAFFWPRKLVEGSETAIWSSLVHMTVEFYYAAPSGRWYFKGSPDDPFNEPASDDPLPISTVGHFPPGYGTAEDTKAALEHNRSLSSNVYPDGLYDERDEFRLLPSDEIMVPLLEAFARRLAHAPSLKSAHLFLQLARGGEWFVSYDALGSYDNEYTSYMTEPYTGSARARVLLHVQDWRPPETLMQMFRDLGKEVNGQEAVVAFLPFLY